MNDRPHYSVVIPAQDEAPNVEPLTHEIAATMEGLGEPYEVIWVDDGSTDETRAQAQRMADGDICAHGKVRVLASDRRSGQTAALDLGLRAAGGAVIITIDADRQNDPKDIPRLLAALQDHDVAVGWRQHRQDSRVKRYTSRFANRLRIAVTADHIHDTGCSLKVLKREVVESIKLFHGMHRFLSTLAKMEGYTVAEVPVSHRPRTAGRSKYSTLNRAIGPFLDLLAVRWMQSRSLHRRRHGG